MAGTITESRKPGYKMQTVILTCVADASDGSLPDHEIDGLGEWFLYSIETIPGGTQPTDNYDIEVRTSRGTDMLGGNGANRDTANKELAYPDTAPGIVDGTLTQVVSGNSINSAEITIVYQFIR